VLKPACTHQVGCGADEAISAAHQSLAGRLQEPEGFQASVIPTDTAESTWMPSIIYFALRAVPVLSSQILNP
jgi:hypothetical protein